MSDKHLRDGLKKLQSFIKQLDFDSTFLEESPEIPLDSLVIPLHIGGELSIDISCNFIELPEAGPLLQFYGQILLDELLEEAAAPVSKEAVLGFINRLNPILPIGQLIYLADEHDADDHKVLGIRYTFPTELDRESELKKCAKILLLLMQVYELLCSCLVLFMDGDETDSILDTIQNLLHAGN